MPLKRLCHQLLDMSGRHRLHTLILLSDLLRNFSILCFHLNVVSLKLFHHFHLHHNRLMASAFLPESKGFLQFPSVQSNQLYFEALIQLYAIILSLSLPMVKVHTYLSAHWIHQCFQTSHLYISDIFLLCLIVFSLKSLNCWSCIFV